MTPKKVDVGPFRYAVYFSPVPLPSENGFTDTNTRTIAVDGTIDETSQAEVLLHEVLHAILDLTNLRGNQEEEEKLVAAVSPLLFGVIRSNPTLLAFLQK